MMSSRRDGGRPISSSRRSTATRQSSMIERHDPIDGCHEIAPAAALRGKHTPPSGSQAIEPAPAFAWLLDPGATYPAAPLEPVEQRIQRRDVETNGAARACLDQLGDFIAVPRAGVGE